MTSADILFLWLTIAFIVAMVDWMIESGDTDNSLTFLVVNLMVWYITCIIWIARGYRKTVKYFRRRKNNAR